MQLKEEAEGMANGQQRNANFPVLSFLVFMGPGAMLADSCSIGLTSVPQPLSNR